MTDSTRLGEAFGLRGPGDTAQETTWHTAVQASNIDADNAVAKFAVAVNSCDGEEASFTALLMVMLRVQWEGIVKQEQFVRCLGAVYAGALQAVARKELRVGEALPSAFRDAVEAESDAEKVSRLFGDPDELRVGARCRRPP